MFCFFSTSLATLLPLADADDGAAGGKAGEGAEGWQHRGRLQVQSPVVVTHCPSDDLYKNHLPQILVMTHYLSDDLPKYHFPQIPVSLMDAYRRSWKWGRYRVAISKVSVS